MYFWRNVMMGPLRAMVVQNVPPHSSRSPTIGPIWKRMRKKTWRLAWLANKTEYSIKSKPDYWDHYPFRKGRGKVRSWISWWACPHQGVLMPSWWWWIDFARWRTSFPLKKVPRPKRWEGCSSATCSSIMAFQRTLCRIETQSSQESFGEPCGSAWGRSSRWTPHSNPKHRKGELGDPTIPKELCDGISTRLGGPFGVGRILLQQFGTFGNGGQPLSNGDGQVTNCAHNLGWATSKWCEWGNTHGHITWWREAELVGNGQGQYWEGA